MDDDQTDKRSNVDDDKVSAAIAISRPIVEAAGHRHHSARELNFDGIDGWAENHGFGFQTKTAVSVLLTAQMIGFSGSGYVSSNDN
jgi:hypothetical protein